MKTNYLILIISALLLGCTKENRTSVDKKSEEKIISSNNKKVSEDADFINSQLSNLEYQTQAFKIGAEKTSNAELKNYLINNITSIKKMDTAYRVFAKDNNVIIEGISADKEKELYKLTMANNKDFDKVFKLYYKDFLSTTIKNNADVVIANSDINALKNQYGNLLYEQKLYFDVLQ